MIQTDSSSLEIKLHHPKKNLEAIKIDIPLDISSVGVMFSGGVDSTLILSLIQLYSKKVRPISIKAFTVEKSDNYEYYGKKILTLDFFAGIEHIMKIPNARSDGVIREGIHHVLNRADIDLVFTGVNRVPEVFIGPIGPRRDTPEEIAAIPKLRCPVLHLTKDYTILALKQIQKEFIGADVYSMTHTCTQSKTPCGNCWFCKERAWGESLIC